MTPAQDIKPGGGLERAVRNSWDQNNLSNSPTAFSLAAQQQSLSSSFGGSFARRGSVAENMKPLKPFNTEDVKILLLENVNKSGQDILRKQGYQVEALTTSLPEDQLIEKIRCVSRRQNRYTQDRTAADLGPPHLPVMSKSSASAPRPS